jgi:hypothetical protein
VPPGPVELDVAALGAERVDGEMPDLVPKEREEKGQLSAGELEDLMREAFKELIAKNDSADFTAGGLPTVKAVKHLTGEDVSALHVADAWQRMKEVKL